MEFISIQNGTNSTRLNYKILLEPEWNNPMLGLFLIAISLVTVFGNVLVIGAVFKEQNLKSVANYYIVSLAVADLIVGLVVMPISALNTVTNNYWFFGDVLCDVWHSIDICASTASINSLLIIALDRYSAISDPISYHNRLLTRYWVLFVLLIWICSVFISFPAIAYWRWLTPIYLPNRCDFPNDLYYLVFSSLVSFYIPLPIMIFVYVRIYRAATRQMNALKTGQKLNCKTSDGKPLILRIHRGGNNNINNNSNANNYYYNNNNTNSISYNNTSTTNTTPAAANTSYINSNSTYFNTNNNYNSYHKQSIAQARQFKTNKLPLELKQNTKIPDLTLSLELLLIDKLKKISPLTRSYSSLVFLKSSHSLLISSRSSSVKNLNIDVDIEQLKKDNLVLKEKVIKKYGLEMGVEKSVKVSNGADRLNTILYYPMSLVSAEINTEPKFSFKSYNFENNEIKHVVKNKKILLSESNKKLIKFCKIHYIGHENLIYLIKTGYDKSNLLSLPKENDHLLSRQSIVSKSNYTINYYGKKILDSFSNKARLTRNDSTISQTSNYYLNFNEYETKSTSYSIATKVKGLTLAKKLKKFTREQKAAKTLGIVMGVFILCWLPFFIYNVITGIFKANMSDYHERIFFVFTWFGYLNSGCNPIIYAFSSREFRRAFYKILFPSSFKKNKKRKNFYISVQNSSTMTRESKFYPTPTKLRSSLYRHKKIENIKTQCPICMAFESVIEKNQLKKIKSISSPVFSVHENEPKSQPNIQSQSQPQSVSMPLSLKGKKQSNSLTKNFRKKLNNVFNSSQNTSSSKRFYSTSLRLSTTKSSKAIYKTSQDLSGSIYNINNNKSCVNNQKLTKLSPSKHSLSVSSMNSGSKKKHGQIPIGTRYRFKTIKPQIENDYQSQIDNYDTIKCSNESSYECNEDDDYFDQIHSNVMKKQLESNNST